MTANQYRNALDKLGLTQAGAAEFLGVSIRTSHGYANGEPIPEGYAKLLRSGGFSGLLQHRFHAEEPGNPFQSGDSHHAATTATQSGADLMTVAHSSILSARALLLSTAPLAAALVLPVQGLPPPHSQNCLGRQPASKPTERVCKSVRIPFSPTDMARRREQVSEKNTGNPVNRTECGEVLMLGEVAEASALLQVIAEDRPPGDYSVKGAINRAARRVSRFLPRGKTLSVSRTEDLWR